MKKILALDLGTKTGFACGIADPMVGTFVLASTKELKAAKRDRMDRRQDMRVLRLFNWLVQMKHRHQFDFIVFEDVQFSTYTAQTQLWSSLRAAVWLAGVDFPPVPVECVPVATLKAFTTGSGSAGKSQMAESMFRRMLNRFDLTKTGLLDRVTNQNLDDNAVDALAVWHWAQHHLGRTT